MPGESWQAYEAFANYRDQGPGRTLKKITKEIPKNISLMKKWSAKYDWVDRANSYDTNEEFERMVMMRERRHKWISEDLAATQKMQEILWRKIEKINPDDLTPAQAIRWYDVISRRQEKILGLTPEAMEEQLKSQANNESELERLMDADEGIRDAVLDYIQRSDEETSS